MASPLRIGMIGLDTSHSPQFTKRLNNPSDPEHVAGGKVVAGYPGGSKDFELSWSRVEGFTKQLRDEFGVQIMDSPEAVAEASDLVFITSCDGRVHLEQLERTLKYRRPTFVDKPMTLSSADAKRMFEMADQAGVPLMSSSSLRYADSLKSALEAGAGQAIVGCDVVGPMSEQPTQPGLFWYGVHTVEILIAVMGAGCRDVRAARNDDFDMIIGTWADGRMGLVRGHRRGHKKYGVTLHREDSFECVDVSKNKRSYYTGLLEAIMHSLPHGRSDIPREQTLDVIRFMEAANEARTTSQVVQL
jgi:predicted dehydrogenase